MKKTSYIILALALSLTIFGLAKSAWADTHTAASCSYADVSAAVSAAAAGDTINVPAGSCTWSNALSITKGLSLIGAGIGNTVITGGSDTIISYNPSNKNANLLFRVSGFTFDLANGNRHGMDISSGNTLVLQTKIRIDHNRFINLLSTNTSYHYIMHANVRGVIDNNIFGSAFYAFRTPTSPIMNQGATCYSGHCEWNNYEGIRLDANDNNLYFEDNDITLADYGQGFVVSDCQEGGRYAYRYNTFHLSGGGGQLFDMHGNFGTGNEGSFSCFGGVIYGNNFLGSGAQSLDQRGGRAFVFYNSYAGGGGYNLRDEQAQADSLPITYVGPNPPQYSMDVNGSYYWQNRVGMTGSLIATGVDNSCGLCRNNAVIVGRDFFDNSSSPGVGCGTLANRPSICSSGQGYWATNQSCTNLTGMVGANPATPISGTLYRCTTLNAWDVGSSPLVYPHPLRGESSVALLYGDISGDGSISAYDASLAAQYAVNLVSLTLTQITAADVSGDGTVSAYDASLIAQKAVGLISKFPVEG